MPAGKSLRWWYHGTQGEPMSALSRAAVDNHKHAQIEKGDTVVLSFKNHSRQREGNLPHDRPSVPASGAMF